jgi:hypothetical protein
MLGWWGCGWAELGCGQRGKKREESGLSPGREERRGSPHIFFPFLFLIFVSLFKTNFQICF